MEHFAEVYPPDPTTKCFTCSGTTKYAVYAKWNENETRKYCCRNCAENDNFCCIPLEQRSEPYWNQLDCMEYHVSRVPVEYEMLVIHDREASIRSEKERERKEESVGFLDLLIEWAESANGELTHLLLARLNDIEVATSITLQALRLEKSLRDFQNHVEDSRAKLVSSVGISTVCMRCKCTKAKSQDDCYYCSDCEDILSKEPNTAPFSMGSDLHLHRPSYDKFADNLGCGK